MQLDKTIGQIQSDLTLACDLTQQIIDLIAQVELDDVEAINSKRLQLIESIFANDKSKIDVELAKKLFDLNAKATHVLQQQVTLNITEQQKLRKGNTAHSAYMQHSM